MNEQNHFVTNLEPNITLQLYLLLGIFIYEGTEALRSWVACPKSHSQISRTSYQYLDTDG